MKKYTVILFLTLAACGERGEQGQPGLNGLSGEISLISAARFTSSAALCPSAAGLLFKVGVDQNGNGLLDADEITFSSVVCDGLNGLDGAKGDQGDPGTPAPQYAVTKFITPCASITSPYREALLRLANGTILSSFSDNLSGANTRLVVLPPGSYIDSDGSNCHFSIDANGILTDQEGGVFTP